MKDQLIRDPLDLYPISRERFERLKSLLPVARRELVPAYVFLNAITFFLFHLPSWRLLDGRYEVTDEHGVEHRIGWNTLYQRYRYWVATGVIDRILEHVRRDVYGSDAAGPEGLAALDSTSVKAAPSSYAGPEGLIGVSRGGRNTKVHAITSNDGVPYADLFTKGNASDCRGGMEMLETVDISRFTYLAADKAYVSRPLRRSIESRGVTPVIPPKKDTRRPWPFTPKLYPGRSIIERLFGRLKRNRHLSCRFDRTDDMFISFVRLSYIVNWLLLDHRPRNGQWTRR